MSLHPPAGSSVTAGRPSYPAASSALEAAFRADRIQGLDFLRALAVSMVMLGHAMEGRADLPVPMGPLSGLGVKVFFVLSGFLITRLLQDEIDRHGSIDFFKFYRRRIARLMPVFYLYLAISMTALWVRGKPIPWDAVGAAVFYVVNYYQAFTGAQTNIVSHCWSLAVEEQFYMLWPLLIAALHARRKNIATALVAVVLGVWCWRLYLLLYTDTSVDYLYRALDTRADELAVGCLLAVLMRSQVWRDRLFAVTRLAIAGPVLMVLLYASALAGSGNEVFKYGFGFMVEPLIIALLIVITLVACTRQGALARLLNGRLVVHVGQVSYCMYLFHGLIMYSTQRVVEARSGSFWFGLAASFAAVILFSSASFRWFETPLRQRISGK